MENEFDLIVIGAGPGGYMAALYGAKEGQRVALIENGYVGGNMTKKMVAFAEQAMSQGQTGAINNAAKTDFPGQNKNN